MKNFDENNKIKQQLTDRFIRNEYELFLKKEDIQNITKYLFKDKNPLVELGSKRQPRLYKLLKKFNKFRKQKFYLMDNKIYYISQVTFDSFFLYFDFIQLEIEQVVDLINKSKLWKKI